MKTHKLTDYKVLETLNVLAIACLVMGFAFHLKVFFVLSLAFLIIGVFVKKLSFLIAHVWLKFAHLLGTINSKILLGAVYFLFLTPIAVVFRFVKGDFMNLRRKGVDERSFWMEKKHKYEAKDMDNVW